jgi:putative nucleotidyltransferase-like protein
MLKSLAIEDQLLFEACRVEIAPDGAERAARLVERGPNWQYVLEASIRHAVAPLLKHGLDRIDEVEGVKPRIPRDFLRDLDELHAGSARRNARLFLAIEEVTGALRAAGAEAVALKDVELAAEVYPDAALRPMGDVDLLVRRGDWDIAARSLESLDFLPRPAGDVPYTRKYAPAQHFRRAADDIWIDLQWNVMEREWDRYADGSFTFDGEEMWTEAVQIETLDFELRAPTLEHMLFHLCLHLEGHRYCELVLFCDIAELVRVRAAEIDWESLLQLGRRYRAQSSLYYVLLFVGQLLGGPVPPEVLDSLEAPFFDAALHSPLFGNLTPLHLSLDEIRLTAAPPSDLLDEYERVSRRQAVQAMKVGSELSALVDALVESGASLAVLGGRSSPRVFPDVTLPAFEPLSLLVLEDDRRQLERVLEERDFDPSAPGLQAKPIKVVSNDPVLAGEESSVELEVSWSSELATVLVKDEEEGTNAASAIRSVRKRLAGPVPEKTSETVHLAVFALPPEQLVVAVAADVGRAREDRLFLTCRLVDLLRKLPRGIDWQAVRELAEQHGVLDDVLAGLAVGAAITDLARDPSVDAAPHVLEWARYGPSSVNRYPWLRAAYYFVLSLAAVKGRKRKLGYLGGALTGQDGRRVLLSIAAGAVRGVAGSVVGRRRASLRDFAYWVEPATSDRLVFVGAESSADATAKHA